MPGDCVAGIEQSSQRADEAAALVARIEQSQATMAYAERSLVAIVRYAAPALLLSKTPETVQQDLVRLVEDDAAGVSELLAR
jgi:hypothetical protein